MSAEIASPANPRVRAALRLRNRRERETTGLTVVDGTREVARALLAGVDVTEAFVCEELLRSDESRGALEALVRAGVRPTTLSGAAFARLAFGDRSDGIVAVARIPQTTLERLALPRDPLVIVLESVEKPGNLGAVLRSADGAGADALIAADPRTDLFNPNAIRASLGTIFSVPVAAAPTPDALAWLRGHGLRIVAARVDAEHLHTEAELTGPLAIALGSEATGLSAAWHAPDVISIRIPMLGVADSLNVSVAAAVLLYEARRQRDAAR